MIKEVSNEINELKNYNGVSESTEFTDSADQKMPSIIMQTSE